MSYRFDQLPEEKKQRIFDAALEVFSRTSYEEASTNDIVRLAAISKGSLFTYFESKEALYLATLDYALKDLVAHYQQVTAPKHSTLKDTLRFYASLEFDWLMQEPIKYALIKRAFHEEDPRIKHTLNVRYGEQSHTMFYALLEPFLAHHPKKEALSQMILWVMEGFNTHMQTTLDTHNLNTLKEDYLNTLEPYLTLIETLL